MRCLKGDMECIQTYLPIINNVYVNGNKPVARAEIWLIDTLSINKHYKPLQHLNMVWHDEGQNESGEAMSEKKLAAVCMY